MRSTQSMSEGISLLNSASVLARRDSCASPVVLNSSDALGNSRPDGTTKRSPTIWMSSRLPSTSRRRPKNSERYLASWFTRLASARFSSLPRFSICTSLLTFSDLAISSASEISASCWRTAASWRFNSSTCAADFADSSVCTASLSLFSSSSARRAAISDSSCAFSACRLARSAPRRFISSSFCSSVPCAVSSSPCVVLSCAAKALRDSEVLLSVAASSRMRLSAAALSLCSIDSVFASCDSSALSWSMVLSRPDSASDSTN